MRTHPSVRSFAAASAVVMLAGAAGAAGAQATDPRWQPWLGCWVSDAAPSPGVAPGAAANGLVCIVPSATGPGVEVATIANGLVAHRERVNATGVRTAKTVDNCPGWESATWSTDGRRVLLRSEFVCGQRTTVKGSGVFAMSADGEWIQVQGNIVGDASSARVVRYRDAGVRLANVADVLRGDSILVSTVPEFIGLPARSARLAAGEPVQPEDVLDVSRHVDHPVAEAWVSALEQGFSVNARQLVSLADAGMPPKMIDLMVALSYPSRFALQRRAGDGPGVGTRESAYGSGRRSTGGFGGSGAYGSRWDCGYGSRMMTYGYYGDSCYPGYYGLSPYYGYDYGYGRYLGYGSYSSGYYWGQQPIIITPRVPNTYSVPGRAVNGLGYTRGGSDRVAPAPSGSTKNSSGGGGGSSAGASSSGSSKGTTTSGSTGGTSTGRTAQPRKPPR